MASSLPVIFCKGTYYNVSYEIAKTFKARIKEYYQLFEDLHKQFIPFYNSDQGKQVCSGYLKVITLSFPNYLDELRGISDGAEIPFEQVLLMHLRVELQTYLGKKQVPECSTVFVNNEETYALAHNEDTSATVYNRGYIISVHIKDTPRGKYKISEEKFTAFCYPGVIPGNSMGFNDSGFIFSMNALYPDFMELNKTPRQFLNRALMSIDSLDGLQALLLDDGDGIACGCSINVAYIHPDKKRIMWNYELCPSQDKRESSVSEYSIGEPGDTGCSTTGFYHHFNMYKHTDVKEMPGRTTSSIHRQKRADELPQPKTIRDMLIILGDTEDKQYPIFRRPSATDSGDTVATGVFDFRKGKFMIYVENPKIDSEPVLEMALPFHI